MRRKIIKTTFSLDPITQKVEKCKIIEKNGKIYMIKTVGGKIREFLIEKDSKLYLLISISQSKDISNIYVEPSMKCNLNCRVCFTYGQKEKVSLSMIRKKLLSYTNKVIGITGGEPTLLRNLFEWIRVIKKTNNIPILITNGIKLARKEYVERLKRNGLLHVALSFNGLTNEVYEIINGAPLLRKKLKALKNLEELGMKVSLGVLIVKGINEEEIGKIINLATFHSSCIKEIRIRIMAPIGRYIKTKPLFLSDIINILCDNLKIKKDEIYKELEFLAKMKKIPFLKISQKSCGFSFHLKIKKRKIVPVGRYLSRLIIFDFIKYSLVVYRFSGILKMILEKIGKRKHIWYFDKDVLKITLRKWPTLYTLDLVDHVKYCNSIYKGGSKDGLHVCYANLMKNLMIQKSAQAKI